MANVRIDLRKVTSQVALLAMISFKALAFEVAPTAFSGSGSGRQSDFQMQQAQEAIRSICGCVVGTQTLNPNCGPITAAALQQQAPYNPATMGMGVQGTLQMPGATSPGMHQAPMMPQQQQPAMMPPGFPGR